MPINAQIDMLIKRLNIKKVEFAKRLKIDQSYVTRLIRGDNEPSERLIDDICREFNVNLLWLKEGKGDMFTVTPQSVVDEIAEDFKLDDIDKKIIEKYLELSDDQRRVIKEYIKSIFT